MSFATVVSIPVFEPEAPGPPGAWAGSIALTSVPVTSQGGLVTMTYLGANSQAVVDSTAVFSVPRLEGLYTGSYLGNANDWSLLDVTQAMTDAGSRGLYTGSYPGNANAGAMYLVPYDDHNKSLITADNPNSDQGGVLVDWNFFVQPTTPAPITGKARDLTRFKKAYSFTRNQPVRIRLIRK